MENINLVSYLLVTPTFRFSLNGISRNETFDYPYYWRERVMCVPDEGDSYDVCLDIEYIVKDSDTLVVKIFENVNHSIVITLDNDLSYPENGGVICLNYNKATVNAIGNVIDSQLAVTNPWYCIGLLDYVFSEIADFIPLLVKVILGEENEQSTQIIENYFKIKKHNEDLAQLRVDEYMIKHIEYEQGFYGRNLIQLNELIIIQS